jgi:hypothetical protein
MPTAASLDSLDGLAAAAVLLLLVDAIDTGVALDATVAEGLVGSEE